MRLALVMACTGALLGDAARATEVATVGSAVPATTQVIAGRQLFHGAPVEGGNLPGRPRRLLFNALSCDGCHKEGGRGEAPSEHGPVPVSLVIELELPASPAAEAHGDPVYGHTFNTLASGEVKPEGWVSVEYEGIEGFYYPDGLRWHMRTPHYRLQGLARGSLAPTTIIKPRIAPSLYGLGLLEAVPEAAIADADGRQGANAGKAAWQIRGSSRALGRFGWQAQAVTIREQTARAFARDLGLTSPDEPRDDCTAREPDCWQAEPAVPPALSAESLDSVSAFVRALPAPQSLPGLQSQGTGAQLFRSLACDQCHRPELPVELGGEDERTSVRVIRPYTDLRLHDMGLALGDMDASGRRVATLWRTAPLWGISQRVKAPAKPTFLHDGRARSTEEAVLWHGGEAGASRQQFMNLGPRHRALLLNWLETL